MAVSLRFAFRLTAPSGDYKEHSDLAKFTENFLPTVKHIGRFLLDDHRCLILAMTDLTKKQGQ
jgi:hypothetical protein